ncbi:MAG: AI-2E family transporter [Tidjanibacter sp.]|nr:AI-2E family transporter [Tidjanibacter sp.]
MNKLAKYIIGSVAVAIAIFLMWRFSNIVAYILIAAVLAIMGQPLVKLISRIHIGRVHVARWLSALIVLAVIWGIAILFFVFFIPVISSKFSVLSHLDYQSIFASLEEPITRFGDFLERYFALNISESSLTEMLTRQVGKVLNLDALNNLLGSVFSVVGSIGLGVVSVSFITFFFMKDEGLFVKMLIALFPARYENNVTHAMDKVSTMLQRYFLGVFAESVIMMLIVSIALLCFGFRAEDAFFSGAAVGIFNVIPYLGPWIGFILSAIAGITFVVGGMSIGTILLIIAGTVFVAQMIDNYLLQPMLYSRQVNAHPLEIFIVMLVAGSLGGIVGMLVAIPAYTVLRVFAKEFFYNYNLVRKLTENMDSVPDRHRKPRSPKASE